MMNPPQAWPVAPPVRSGSLGAALLCLTAAALCPLIPLVPVSNLFLYVVVLAMALCVVVPVWYSWRRLDWFEPVHVLGGLYFVYFGLGSLWTVHDPEVAAYDLYIPPHVPTAAAYCLLGYLAALAAYYAPWYRPLTPRHRESPVGVGLLLMVGVVGLVGFTARAILQQSFRPGSHVNVLVTTASQLWPLFVFGWALAWQLYFSKRLTRAQRAVLFGVLTPGALIVIFLTFGNKSLSMMLVGLPIVSRWYVKRKIPWTLLLVLLLVLVFVVFPLYNTYRWFDRDVSHSQRMSQSYDTVSRWNSTTFLRNSVGTFKSRMAVINSVAIVVRDVGRWQPYAKGETILLPIVTYFIPRALWAGKPTSAAGLDFGRRFRVTNFFTREVYIAPSWPGELYWNFGVPGVVLGLAAAAVFLRVLYRRYVEGASGPVPIAIWIMLLSQCMVMLEGSLAPSIVEIARTLIFIEVLRHVAVNYGFIEREPLAP